HGEARAGLVFELVRVDVPAALAQPARPHGEPLEQLRGERRVAGAFVEIGAAEHQDVLGHGETSFLRERSRGRRIDIEPSAAAMSIRAASDRSGSMEANMHTSKKIAVVGATGRLGRPLADILRARGHRVTAISRALGVDVVTGAGLAAALDGADVVID